MFPKGLHRPVLNHCPLLLDMDLIKDGKTSLGLRVCGSNINPLNRMLKLGGKKMFLLDG